MRIAASKIIDRDAAPRATRLSFNDRQEDHCSVRFGARRQTGRTRRCQPGPMSCVFGVSFEPQSMAKIATQSGAA
jgi:hypothetical protein